MKRSCISPQGWFKQPLARSSTRSCPNLLPPPLKANPAPMGEFGGEALGGGMLRFWVVLFSWRHKVGGPPSSGGGWGGPTCPISPGRLWMRSKGLGSAMGDAWIDPSSSGSPGGSGGCQHPQQALQKVRF